MEKELEASKIKLGQLQINVWPTDGSENSEIWKQGIEILRNYQEKKEKKEFSIDQLCKDIKKLYELSKDSDGILWGDATTVFIPNSAVIDKKQGE